MPFLEEAGFEAPFVFDFRVPGVTSISCDPHKYGLGPKGVSCLMFRNSSYRDSQFFCEAKWPGGLYATTALAGSRPGNIVIGTWAVMMKIGRSGYVANAKKIFEAVQGIKAAIKAEMPEISYASQQCSPVVTIVGTGKKDSINPMALKPLMAECGFILSPVQQPSGLHISMTMGIAQDWHKLVAALKKSVKKIKDHPELNTTETIATYGMTA